MLDRLQNYHSALRMTGSSGYPNMSYYNPQHQQQPYPLAGAPEQYYDPYQRLPPTPPRRTYRQRPQQSLGVNHRYGTRSPYGLPAY